MNVIELMKLGKLHVGFWISTVGSGLISFFQGDTWGILIFRVVTAAMIYTLIMIIIVKLSNKKKSKNALKIESVLRGDLEDDKT